jgi:hypothetical protein
MEYALGTAIIPKPPIIPIAGDPPRQAPRHGTSSESPESQLENESREKKIHLPLVHAPPSPPVLALSYPLLHLRDLLLPPHPSFNTQASQDRLNGRLSRGLTEDARGCRG